MTARKTLVPFFLHTTYFLTCTKSIPVCVFVIFTQGNCTQFFLSQSQCSVQSYLAALEELKGKHCRDNYDDYRKIYVQSTNKNCYLIGKLYFMDLKKSRRCFAIPAKGQIISKGLFGILKFVCSFFGRIRVYQKSFRNYLTFTHRKTKQSHKMRQTLV